MLRHIRPALVMLIGFSVLTGILYPLAVTGIADAVFPWQSQGSMIERGGKVAGSALIGQYFTAAKYLHSRPSATTPPYAADNSAGSNLGPTSKALVDRVGGDIAKLQAEHPGVPVPGDLVTTSASGLDPDISPAAAAFQMPRVAQARGLSQDKVSAIIAAHTAPRWLGVFGEPHVNVLAVNLALDEAAP